jgi:serine/threonine-protein kinase HipA
MARRRSRIPLNVYLNGRPVGRLQRAASGAIDFQYDPEWLQWENAIPVSLSLPLREDRFIGDPVFAVFDNLLPDNDGIRARLAEKAGAEGDDAYSLLAAVGRDCVGALQFLPDGEEQGASGAVSGRRVSDGEIAKIIANLARNPLGISDDEEFRISIAGAQEKTALLFWKKRWHVPHGTTATTHILKPQLGKLPNGIDMSQSVENEHLCLRIVDALGIPAAASEIVDFDDRRVLVVERFDRLWTRDKRLLRIPQEDMCQALSVPPSRKYEADGGPGILRIAELLKGSDTPEQDRLMFLKAQVVFWLLAAIDGHAKNFSIRLASGGRFQLTPLYDVMSAQPALDANQIRHNKTKLAMAVGDNRHYVVKQIAPRQFAQTGALCGLPSKEVIRMLQELVDTGAAAINDAIGGLPEDFPADLAECIAVAAKDRLERIALFLATL